MATALDMLYNLQSLDVHALAVETATEAEPDMVEAMQSQLSEGRRADGSEISPPYAPFTIEQKEKKTGLASVVDVVTLFDTGSHYAGLFAKVQDDVIDYGSTDKKSASLQDRYGKIYGLDEESREGLVEDFIHPRFESKVAKETGLEFD